MTTMDDTKRLVIGTAMQAMFKKGWVDITAIRKCLEIASIVAPAEPLRNLEALHCVHFSDMPPELVQRIPGMLQECFRGLDLNSLVPPAPIPEPSKPDRPRHGWLKLLQ